MAAPPAARRPGLAPAPAPRAAAGGGPRQRSALPRRIGRALPSAWPAARDRLPGGTTRPERRRRGAAGSEENPEGRESRPRGPRRPVRNRAGVAARTSFLVPTGVERGSPRPRRARGAGSEGAPVCPAPRGPLAWRLHRGGLNGLSRKIELIGESVWNRPRRSTDPPRGLLVSFQKSEQVTHWAKMMPLPTICFVHPVPSCASSTGSIGTVNQSS
nr:translation initiation factor IF-2-like [Oryctolagus cuniculus]